MMLPAGDGGEHVDLIAVLKRRVKLRAPPIAKNAEMPPDARRLIAKPVTHTGPPGIESGDHIGDRLGRDFHLRERARKKSEQRPR